MKTMKGIIAMFLICVAASASAQVETTAYGKRYNNNRNLRFTDGEKTQTVVTVLGSASLGDYEAYGADLEIRRQHEYFSLGGSVGTENSSIYGWSNHAYLLAGVNTSAKKVFSLGVDGDLGFAQGHIDTELDNGHGYSSLEKTSKWKLFAQASIVANVQLGDGWKLTGRFGIRHSFIATGDKEELPAGTWSVGEQTTDASRLFAQVGISKAFGVSRQISGDNCWRIAGFGGFSNLGFYGGTEALHFKRTAANWGRELGFGTQWTNGDNAPLNEVFVKAGLVYLPSGANSPIVFPFGISAGFGEFERENSSMTYADNGYTLTENSRYTSYGIDGKVYGGADLHFGSWTIGLRGFVGGYKCVGKSYKDSSDKLYDGTEGKTSGLLYGWEGRVTLAF